MDITAVVKKLRGSGLRNLASQIHDLDVLNKRRESKHENRPRFDEGEPMTEREFVRSFGTKVKTVHWSGNPDFVGLSVRGDRLGILITKNKDERRCRFIVKDDNSWHVSKKYIPLRDKDSLSRMARSKGLIRNVS